MISEPLVSVPVITYNSSKFVLETLESIKAQTYQNIELIISDDCSTDDTVKLCKDWVEENRNRFVRVEIVESPVNTGVSANLNRSEAACHGEWVKPIAGDDLLEIECISSFIAYINDNPKSEVLFSRVSVFGPSRDRIAFFNSFFDYSFFNLSTEKQIDRLILQGNCIPAASYFYNRSILIEKNIHNDERIPLLEDLPKWINILRAGISMSFVDKSLVRYRVGQSGLSSGSGSIAFLRSNRLYYLYYVFPYERMFNEEAAVSRVVDYEMTLHARIDALKSSSSYRIGHFIVNLFLWLKR